MTQTKFIENWLMTNCNMTTAQGCAEGTGLTKIYKTLFGGKGVKQKVEAVRELAKFYSDEQNIMNIWNGTAKITTQIFLTSEELEEELNALSETEKAFIIPVVQYGGYEFKPTSKKIAEELGLEYKADKNKYYNYYRKPDIFSGNDYPYEYFHLAFLHLLTQYFPKTMAVALFPGGREMPPFVLSVLKTIIPPFEYNYTDFKPAKKDYIICRENRLNDFAAVVRFAGGEKLKVKANTFDITKSKMARMSEVIRFEEVCEKDGKFCTPKEAVRINDFKVALPLFMLAANIGLVETDNDGNVVPSAKSVELLSETPHLFAKKLFKSYMKYNKIYETHYVTYISVYDGDSFVEWGKCREVIVNLLKTCPAEKWINFLDFEKYMIIFHANFFRLNLDSNVYIQGHTAGYYGSVPDWYACEARIIYVILSFLGAMGILDIAYKENVVRFREERNDYCVGISGFRITPLGAWILGLSKEYVPSETNSAGSVQESEGGFIIQPDYTIIISGLKNRIKHESYLSGFLTKVSNDENVSIYKIDFASMVRAYNNGIQPKMIKEYLEKVVKKSQPFPDNVARSLDDWQSKVGRVKIREVTLIECDDELVLEELIHAKPMQNILGEKVKYAAVITENKNKTRVKSYAERNGWLVESVEIKSGKKSAKGRGNY